MLLARKSQTFGVDSTLRVYIFLFTRDTIPLTFNLDCSLMSTTLISSLVAGCTLILMGIIVGQTVNCQSLGGHRSPSILHTIYSNAYWDIIDVLHPLYAVDFRTSHVTVYCDTFAKPTNTISTSSNCQIT